MKTFYCVLYALITAETGEKISLGLLLSDGNKSLFRYSKTKFSALKDFIPDEQHRFIRNYLRSFEDNAYFSEDFHRIKFVEKELNPMAVSEGYIEYLSRYNQNIVTFGKPVNVNVPVDETAFDNLFKVLINEKETPIRYGRHRLQQVKRDFSVKVSSYYKAERKISPEEYHELIMPVKIDLFGRNKDFVFAQFIDFERQLPLVKIDFFDIEKLREVFKIGKGFIVSTEPDESKFQAQHLAWNSIYNTSVLGEYLDIEETDKIMQYAEEHGVQPF